MSPKPTFSKCSETGNMVCYHHTEVLAVLPDAMRSLCAILHGQLAALRRRRALPCPLPLHHPTNPNLHISAQTFLQEGCSS